MLEYRRRFGIGAEDVGERVTSALKRLQGENAAERVLAALEGMDQEAGRIVAYVLEKALVCVTLTHLDRVAVVKRIDWKALHRAIHDGNLALEIRGLVKQDAYREFSEDPDRLDDLTDDEVAVMMLGGPDYHEKVAGEELTVDILESHGLPTDPKKLVRIADAYPRIKRDR